MIAALLLGTLPLALALVPAVENAVLAIEARPDWIGVGLLVTAGLLAFTHYARTRSDDPEATPTALQALLIGLFQLGAIVPGISRSGATIAAALALGLPRLPAARFSFLLSIPAILGASLKEIVAVSQAPASAVPLDPLPFVVGFFASLIVGLASLRLLVHLLVRVGLLPFVPYLLVVGVVALLLS
jgi:undecaprenyl-diphosphatase